MTKKFYESVDLKQNEVLNTNKVQILQDASGDDEAVRKLQAETISALAVQAQIVATSAQASGSTMFSSAYTNTALATKQPTMSIDASSTAYLEIVDGYKIKLKDLGILTPHKDTVSADMAAFIAGSTFLGDNTVQAPSGDVLDAMTFIFLENATNPAERSFIYLGTNNGTADDFVSFSVDYNAGEIRSFFGATGTGIAYDAGTGIYSLVIGNGSGELGGHSIPVDSAEFNTVNGSTILAILKALEAFIENVDSTATSGQTTVDTRLSSLVGVAGNNLGSFTDGIFSDNLNVKQVLQESESAHLAATNDRAAIRSEQIAGDASLQNDITSLTGAMVIGDINLTNQINQETADRIAHDAIHTASILAETSNREAADLALDARLDVVEGDSLTSGSIAKAEADAKAHAETYADGVVASEQNRALLAEAALDLKIDNLQEGDIKFIGTINASGVVGMRAAQIAVEDPSSRNGLNFVDVYFNAGEVFVVLADVTVTFGDASERVLLAGDRLMALEDRTAGNATALDFNVVVADQTALSIYNVDGNTIDLDQITLDLEVVDGSLGHAKLETSLSDQINDHRSLTTNNSITSDADTHFVSSIGLGDQQNMHYKRTQLGSGALTDTVKTVLSELFINSDGSGDSALPNYAYTTSHTVEYLGSCVDSSVVVAAGNFEAKGKNGTAVQATGVYARADSEQLGVNVGITAIADNGASSNVGAVAFSGTSGVGKDRGLVASVSEFDILAYSGLRVADPFPFNDICIVADAKYSPNGTMAFYSYGDVKFDTGVVEVEDAPTTDKGVIRKKDVKDRQNIFQMNLSDNVAQVVTCTLDLDKSIIQVVHNDDDIEVKISRDNINNQITVTAQGGNLTNCYVLVQEMTVDATVVATP